MAEIASAVCTLGTAQGEQAALTRAGVGAGGRVREGGAGEHLLTPERGGGRGGGSGGGHENGSPHHSLGKEWARDWLSSQAQRVRL